MEQLRKSHVIEVKSEYQRQILKSVGMKTWECQSQFKLNYCQVMFVATVSSRNRFYYTYSLLQFPCVPLYCADVFYISRHDQSRAFSLSLIESESRIPFGYSVSKPNRWTFFNIEFSHLLPRKCPEFISSPSPLSKRGMHRFWALNSSYLVYLVSA